MSWVIGRKVLAVVPVLLAVSFLTFAGTALLRGCVECQVAGVDQLDEETRAEIRAELRLDDPVPQRYAAWLGDAVTGELGRSHRTQQDVSEAIAERLPVTLELAVLSIVLSLAVSVPLGAISAYREGGLFDRAVTGGSFALLAVPSFLLAILLIQFMAVDRNWFDATGWTALTDDPIGNLRTAFLPSLALAGSNIAVFTRMLRSDMVATLREDHVTAARARGLPTWHILFRHCLRPSSFSLLTVAGLAVGNLLAGAVIVERLFALPGLGRLLFMSVEARDLVMVQGVVLVVAVAFVAVNTLVDVLYGVLDPRVRQSGVVRG